MSLKRWSLAIAFSLPLISLFSLTGCGEAPSNAPQAEQTQEELDSYNKRMKETGGRG